MEINGQMEVSTTTPESEDLEEKRIRFFKTALNLYRSRSFSLQLGLELRTSNAFVPEHMKSYEYLRKQIHGLHNEVALLKAFQDSVDVIHNTLTCMGFSNLRDEIMKRKIQKTAEEVSFYSHHIISLYEENLNEIKNIRLKQEYIDNLSNCHRSLNSSKNQQRLLPKTAEESRRWQRAEGKVAKINIIREIKQILISKLGCRSKDYPSLQTLRTPYRKSLTVDDFTERWDVGLVKAISSE